MDWLSNYRADIDCLKQKITLSRPTGKEIVHKGMPRGSGVRLISTIKAHKLLGRGYEGYLFNVVRTETPEDSPENIPIVQEFFDVFPKEIPGKPSPRKVEFCIDLIPGSTAVPRALYRMAPAKLKELKTQLVELLEKGYIRPSTSPWRPRYFLRRRTES